jgi:hypothetical protein
VTAHTTGASQASDTVQSLVLAVLDRMPELTGRLVKQIYAEEESYASSGAVGKDDLWRSFSDNMRDVLRCLGGLAPVGRDLYEAPRATGARRAEQRMPLESVLHTYRLGTEVMWDALLDEARSRSPEVREELIENAARLFQLVDRFSLAMVESYRTREGQIRRLDAQRRDAVVDSLLEGHGSDPSVQVQAASVLGLPAHARYVVVVTGREVGGLDSGRSPQELMSAAGIHSAWRPRADRTVGVLRLGALPLSQAVEHLTLALPHGAGISGEVASLAEIGIAYQLAELTYQTLGRGSEIVVLDDRLPEALLVSNPQLARRLARGTLGRVLDLDPGERDLLLQTLETWFHSERSSSRAAEQLYCHRNTVLNRLGRIESLTGGSLESDRHLLMCSLALMAARLAPAAPSSPLPAATSPDSA